MTTLQDLRKKQLDAFLQSDANATIDQRISAEFDSLVILAQRALSEKAGLSKQGFKKELRKWLERELDSLAVFDGVDFEAEAKKIWEGQEDLLKEAETLDEARGGNAAAGPADGKKGKRARQPEEGPSDGITPKKPEVKKRTKNSHLSKVSNPDIPILQDPSPMDETPSTTRPTSPIPHQEGPTIGPKNLHTGQTVAASFTIQESGGPRAVVYSVRLDSYDPIKGTYRISDPDPDPISLESEWDVSPDDIVDYIAPRQDALEVGTMVYALFNLARVGKRREMSTEFYTAEIKKVLSEGRKGLRYYVHYPDEPGNLSVVYPGEIFPMSEGKWSKSIQ